MKIGIIIIFHDNEKLINVNLLTKQIKQAENLEICLVNNSSKDNTNQLLNSIKDAGLNNLSILSFEKFKSDVSAIRVAAKHMLKHSNLDYIGYISGNFLNTKYHDLNTLLAAASKNQKSILKHHLETKENQRANASLFESLFSVIQYLEQIKESPRLFSFQF